MKNKAFFLFITLLLSIDLLHSDCLTLKDIVKSVEHLEIGRQISFVTENGETVSGTMFSILDNNGQKLIALNVDGQKQYFHLNKVIPNSLHIAIGRPMRTRGAPIIKAPVSQMPEPIALTLQEEVTRLSDTITEITIPTQTPQKPSISLQKKSPKIELPRQLQSNIPETAKTIHMEPTRILVQIDPTKIPKPLLPSPHLSSEVRHSLQIDFKRGYFSQANEIYVKYLKQTHPIPSQGYKLHVSANLDNYAEVSEIVLPILQKHSVLHKVLKSKEHLAGLSGTQIGKYITIYPPNDQVAAMIAKEIDDALVAARISKGYIIPNERSLGRSGSVYTRYGEFNNKSMINPKTGQAVRDVRNGPYRPDWVDNDPFTPAGL